VQHVIDPVGALVRGVTLAHGVHLIKRKKKRESIILDKNYN